MVLDSKLSRRQLLQAGAARRRGRRALPLGPAGVFAAPAREGKGVGSSRPARSAPSPSRSVMSRAAWASRPATHHWAYLGGANFPEDPTDLGPLVPLPGGWRALRVPGAAGFTQIEFAGYGQNAANPGGAAA